MNFGFRDGLIRSNALLKYQIRTFPRAIAYWSDQTDGYFFAMTASVELLYARRSVQPAAISIDGLMRSKSGDSRRAGRGRLILVIAADKENDAILKYMPARSSPG